MSNRNPKLARRRFLTGAGAGAAAIGTLGVGTVTAFAQSTSGSGGHWEPARHAEDEWFDRIPGKHRFFFDTITAEGLAQALLFSNNYFNANKSGYGLDSADLAVVICVRHRSTAFAFSDAMWAKYGRPLSERANYTDSRTSEPPSVNPYQASGRNVTLDAFIEKGGHFAVCQMATRACARTIARQNGGDAGQIYEELVANMVRNSHIVPAGIVAVNRAQEYGYAFAYTG